jgi:hypothetical protein
VGSERFDDQEPVLRMKVCRRFWQHHPLFASLSDINPDIQCNPSLGQQHSCLDKTAQGLKPDIYIYRTGRKHECSARLSQPTPAYWFALDGQLWPFSLLRYSVSPVVLFISICELLPVVRQIVLRLVPTRHVDVEVLLLSAGFPVVAVDVDCTVSVFDVVYFRNLDNFTIFR